MITVKFFAALREALPVSQMEYPYEKTMTVEQLCWQLGEQGQQWQALLQQPVLFAVNQGLCDKTTIVHDGDEVAFFPPVTGG